MGFLPTSRESERAAGTLPGRNGAGRNERRDSDDLLAPLSLFYERAGRPLPQAWEVAPKAVPEPYRALLVHSRDMTPTLEAYHGGRIRLRLLDRVHQGDHFARQVVLQMTDTLAPVEFGAIIIHLERFPPEARETILQCRTPLGTVLADFLIAHVSWPSAFFGLEADPTIVEALGLPEPRTLYGRRNRMADGGGAPIADVIEVLPPLPD